MLHLFLIVVSYGAFMILLMPLTRKGVVLTAVMLFLGIGLIIYKKIHKVAFWKNKQYFYIPIAILISAVSGVNFYTQWCISSKVHVIATMLHLPIEMMLLITSPILSILSIYFLYALLQTTEKKLSDTDPQHDLAINLAFCIIASIATVISAQVLIDTRVFAMGCFNFIFNILIVSTVILFMYCLFRRIIPSIFLGANFFMVLSTINAYVYKFRERLFEPVDVFSAGTAINVMDNYRLFPIPRGVWAGWGIFTALLIILYRLQHKFKAKLAAKKRCVLLVICAICTVAISFYAANLKTYHWHKEGAYYNGYILDFITKFKEISAVKPDNYNTETIAKLADQYALNNYEPESHPEKYPHIIVIMDEAFSDLSVIGEFSTNTEVMPFISSLKENTISGYTLTSVYGGNTANSEYEFLTGNSMAWLSPNVVPYQQYIRSSTYSMASYLNSSYNYKCVAMHPYQSSGWNRPTAYKHLGFDESYFVEDFPQMNYVRNYVSNQEMFEFLIETYEAQRENPLFLFGVTMQNHGDYTYTGENYTKYISLNDYGDEFPEVEQYLSLIHETDKSVEYLITYFQNVDEDVIIVFFGDHQPKIDESFYKTISGTTADTLEEQQKRYEVPFFIWANYNIEEEYVDCTSLNYLSSYVYNAAGVALPPYNQFLQAMKDRIPAINANGFFSLSTECYLPFDEANEDELKWLESYEILQYNSLFDKRHRNDVLFPALE